MILVAPGPLRVFTMAREGYRQRLGVRTRYKGVQCIEILGSLLECDMQAAPQGWQGKCELAPAPADVRSRYPAMRPPLAVVINRIARMRVMGQKREYKCQDLGWEQGW